MGNLFWQAIAGPVLAGIALSFALERQIRPCVMPFWRRGAHSAGTHVGIWVLVFCAELLAFRRPWLATVNTCVVYYVLVLINNAKLQALREPFIFQDFDYCVDMLKHPRLYLPFLGMGRTLVGVGAIVGALYVGLNLEPSLLTKVAAGDFVVGVIAIAAAGSMPLRIASRTSLPITFDAQADLCRLGFLPFLFAYAIAEKSMRMQPPIVATSKLVTSRSQPLPHLVVVQSESFFDARRHFPLVRRDVLATYDEIAKSALYRGRLAVPAWGANTVRTEFAFLSGLEQTHLGVHRFNPYRRMIGAPFPTIATRLQSMGYRTGCIHPYPASFYSRDRVFPLLGFDEFLDIDAFDAKKQGGPFVDDVALAKKVCEYLSRTSSQPLFVFVITMENHGPLHLESPHSAEDHQYYLEPPPAGCSDLSAYLRHIANADRMIGMLRGHLESLPHPSWLCWYGDHVPIMPSVYRAMGYPDGTTDYFIWKKGGVPDGGESFDISVEQLATLLLGGMQIKSVTA